MTTDNFFFKNDSVWHLIFAVCTWYEPPFCCPSWQTSELCLTVWSGFGAARVVCLNFGFRFQWHATKQQIIFERIVQEWLNDTWITNSLSVSEVSSSVFNTQHQKIASVQWSKQEILEKWQIVLFPFLTVTFKTLVYSRYVFTSVIDNYFFIWLFIYLFIHSFIRFVRFRRL